MEGAAIVLMHLVRWWTHAQRYEIELDGPIAFHELLRHFHRVLHIKTALSSCIKPSYMVADACSCISMQAEY